MPTVFLFDVDGTLVLTGGAGRRALSRAFAKMCGDPNACDAMEFGGMTDRAIARTGLKKAGHDDSDASIARLLELYVGCLQDEVDNSPNYRIMPGVVDLLREVSSWSGVALGLGTGNVRRGAQMKLARGGLWEFFSFGGFGCDHEHRAELLRAGAQRGAQALGTPLSQCRTVVIGDTPRDVVAAHAIGATCVGVASGGSTADELEGAGADFTFATLEDSRVVEVLRPPM